MEKIFFIAFLFFEEIFFRRISLQKSPEQVQAMVFKAYALMFLNRLQEAAFHEAQDRMKRQVHLEQGKFEVALPEESITEDLKMLYQRMGR